MLRPYPLKTIFLILALLIWTSLFFIQKTNLAASDLGRHITNGRIIVESGQVFHQNLYSYTHPDFHAPNHHWLFGVIAFVSYQLVGFAGLTILSSFFYTSALAIILIFVLKKTSVTAALISFMIALPIYTQRTEIRPEFISLLFFSLILVLFFNWLSNASRKNYLILLLTGCVILALWVNIHIFFILAGVLGFSALIHILVNRHWQLIPYLIGLAGAWGVATLLNPLGLEGVLYPFVIFTNYGYRVAENQPIWFYLQHFTQPVHWYLIGIILLTALLTAKFYWLNFKQNAYIVISTIITASLTLYMIRFHNLFSLALIAFLAIAIEDRLPQLRRLSKKIWNNTVWLSCSGLAVVSAFILLFTNNLIWPFSAGFGLGLYPNYFASTQFLESQQPHGNIFNNFDSGSFLIFTLYPQQKVFIDNRAEAYPADFVMGEYIAAQESSAVWHRIQEKYDLGIIYYYRHDMTNWGQHFLIERLADPEWVPVFVDNYVIIFVKNIPENQSIIERFRIPDELFSITQN